MATAAAEKALCSSCSWPARAANAGRCTVMGPSSSEQVHFSSRCFIRSSSLCSYSSKPMEASSPQANKISTRVFPSFQPQSRIMAFSYPLQKHRRDSQRRGHSLHSSCIFIGPTGRRPVVVAEDKGASDVPAFKGFPPMQTKPAFYWRMLAVVPYIMPFCEGWLYAETANSLHHVLQLHEIISSPVLHLLSRLPGWFMLAYFFAAYLGVVRNNRWPHFLRFHVVTGMLLEIILQVVGTVNDWIPPSLYWGKLGAHFWLAVATAFIFIVIECVLCALQGMYADVPFISDAAYMQIPYE